MAADKLSGLVSEEGRPAENIADTQDGSLEKPAGAGPGGGPDLAAAEHDHDPDTRPDADEQLDGTRRQIAGIAGGAGIPPLDVSGFSHQGPDPAREPADGRTPDEAGDERA